MSKFSGLLLEHIVLCGRFIGRIARFICLSVFPSVLHGLLTQNRENERLV